MAKFLGTYFVSATHTGPGPFSQGYRRLLGALCAQRGPRQAPRWRQPTDGVVLLHDDVLCMCVCVYTFLCVVASCLIHTSCIIESASGFSPL